MVTCAQVLAALVTAIPIQSASVMKPATSGPYTLKREPPAWNKFRQIFTAEGIKVPLGQLDIPDFYDAASDDAVALTIATADQGWYANILLTIGAVKF